MMTTPAPPPSRDCGTPESRHAEKRWSRADRSSPLSTVFIQIAIAVGGALWFLPAAFDLFLHTTDIETHYRWSVQFGQELSNGILYPRWAPLANGGLGEPSFLYYPPLFFYQAYLFSLALPSYWWAMKAAIVINGSLASLIANAVFRQIGTDRASEAIASILLPSSPMVIFVLYEHNAVPWFATLPRAIWLVGSSIVHVSQPQAFPSRVTVAMCLVCATHILTAFMLILTLPVALLTMVWLKSLDMRRKVSILATWCLATLLGLALAAFYLLPALATQSLVSPDRWFIPEDVDWRNSFSLALISSWLYGTRWMVVQ